LLVGNIDMKLCVRMLHIKELAGNNIEFEIVFVIMLHTYGLTIQSYGNVCFENVTYKRAS
jgi:hypothetical protein